MDELTLDHMIEFCERRAQLATYHLAYAEDGYMADVCKEERDMYDAIAEQLYRMKGLEK